MGNISLRPYQQEALEAVRAEFRRGFRRTIVSIPTGGGKCVSPDTLVWSNGLRRFGDLWGSDTILGPSGPAKVNGWYDDGEREGKKVTLENGFEIDGTNEHRVWVFQRGWVKLSELELRDQVAVAYGQASYGSFVYRAKGTAPNPDLDASTIGMALRYGRRFDVPSSILGGSQYTIRVFLAALFTGVQSPMFHGKNEDIDRPIKLTALAARQVAMMLVGMGIHCSLGKTNSPEWLTVHIDNVPAFNEAVFFEMVRQFTLSYSIRSIESSVCRRIDCEVDEQHAFIGNGIINHNTIIFTFATYHARERGNRTCIIVNTDELVGQTVDKLTRIGLQAGIVKQHDNDWSNDVVVASIQTLSRPKRLAAIPPDFYRMIIVDECHFSFAPTYQRVLKHFKDSWVLGVTATPFRGDRKSLADAGWESIAYVYNINKAIEDGYLVKPDAFRIVTDVDLDKIRRARKNGDTDFDSEELEATVNTVERNATIVEAYERRGEGTRAVAFCVGVKHAFDLANAFRKRGIESWPIYGDMPLEERRHLLARHQAGQFPVITNCAVLTHGYDDPGLGCVIMARPTQSKTLYVQCLGRGLRPSAGKTKCIVLDIVDCTKKHKLLIADEIIKLEREMSGEQPTEAARKAMLRNERGLGKGGKAGPEKKKFGNEDDPEAWKAKQVDLLEKQKAKEEAKKKLAASPPTPAQRRFLFMKLTRDFGWPESAARLAAADKAHTRGSVPKFLGRVKYGFVEPKNYEPLEAG